MVDDGLRPYPPYILFDSSRKVDQSDASRAEGCHPPNKKTAPKGAVFFLFQTPFLSAFTLNRVPIPIGIQRIIQLGRIIGLHPKEPAVVVR